ncbi:MAG: RDD family protein [Deltaproteobacteria bacterium]|nr:RDD family protein [Deltaproteobacteria bacterium]
MTFYYGGFWRRFAAISIDTIILDLFTIILSLIGNFIIPLDDGFTYAVIIPYYGMAVLLNAAYFTYFHGTTGQTPGKRLFGLRVVQADGAPMTPGIAFLRWVGYIISKVPLLLGFLWAAFDGRKQGWHDKIAGTVVIRTIEDRRATDRVSSDARFGPSRGYASAGGGFPYGSGGEYGTPEEDGSDGKNT